MEVHPHTHTERKKWYHYLWEFLMLFLAVFCGFLAENQREHIVEHQREKRYMVTLKEDLEVDTADMGRLKRTLAKVLARKDSIDKYLRPPVSVEKIAGYYKESWVIPAIRGYTYNDRTVEELRSSGNYRLIRSKNITDSLIAYDIRMRGTFSRNYDVLFQSRLKLIELQNDILDMGLASRYFDENDNLRVDSLKKNKLWPLRLLTDDPKILFHYYNSCISHLGFITDLQAWVELMTNKATNLITMIQKEYQLE